LQINVEMHAGDHSMNRITSRERIREKITRM